MSFLDYRNDLNATQLGFLGSTTQQAGWTEANGIALGPKPRSEYWGEVPQSLMQTVLQGAHDLGWENAVRQLIVPNFPHLKSMIFSSSRIDWVNLLPRPPKIILDVGSGWGQTSFLYAKQAERVLSLEPVLERAQFQAIRRKQESVKNLDIICSKFQDLDLTQNSIDLASFTGVLEWVGQSGAPASPRKIQVDLLKSVRKALNPEGFICVGIENRIGFNNILGARDHSGLRFTSLMPRSMASAYMFARKPSYRANSFSSSYRTYTYSLRGYKQLFLESGFQSPTIYVAHPHYAQPTCLIKTNPKVIGSFFKDTYRPRGIKDVLFSRIFQALSAIGLSHVFAPHFVILAQPNEKNNS